MAEKIDRFDTLGRRPVARIRLAQYTWAADATAAVTKDLPFTGTMNRFAVIASNATNAITYTVAFEDEDDVALSTTASIARNGTTVTALTAGQPLHIPAGCSVKVTPSGAPGAGGSTVDVIVYGV